MVADHLAFLHGECEVMVKSDKRRDLSNMYKLLKPIECGLNVLVQEVQKHIAQIGLSAIAQGGDVVSKSETPAQLFVESILSVHKKHHSLIKEVFKGDQQFIGALDKACASVINYRINTKQPCKSPELLARYCDALLKRSMRGMTETEVDEKLTQSITVFKYVEDKDVFQKFYAKMLAKRLIHSQSVSMDSEEAMINKLKQACGYEFTSKLHRMFTDIKLSDDLNNQFSSWCKQEPAQRDLGGINFSIFVLQAGAWPLGQTAISPFAIPQPFEKSVSNFEAYYNSKFNGRKLTWLHHLSSVDMKWSFTKKVYTVQMTTYHMAVLYLFETSNTLTYKEIQENTKLSDDQLLKHLQSFLDIKLIKADHPCLAQVELPPQASTVATEDGVPKSTGPSILGLSPIPNDLKFSLNLSFVSKRPKFKITAIAQKEVQQVRARAPVHVALMLCAKNFVLILAF